MRKPFQGVLNIVRFNWHFYALASVIVFVLLLIVPFVPRVIEVFLVISSVTIAAVVLTSLLVSYYVYDLSNLYKLNWMDRIKLSDGDSILNVHAGFDEIGKLLYDKFPSSTVTLFDFYDPLKHTEISIQRARKINPPSPETMSVKTSQLPLPDSSVDTSLLFLSAHEVRSEPERHLFFCELRRITKPTGQVVVTEHLRDANNLLAYNLGYLHFYSRKTWSKTFSSAGFKILGEFEITPFITTFILGNDGGTS